MLEHMSRYLNPGAKFLYRPIKEFHQIGSNKLCEYLKQSAGPILRSYCA